MAGITLEIAEARLAEYLAAEASVLEGQAYTIFGSRQMTRANLDEIRKGIQYWNGEITILSARAARVPRTVTMRPLF